MHLTTDVYHGWTRQILVSGVLAAVAYGWNVVDALIFSRRK